MCAEDPRSLLLPKRFLPWSHSVAQNPLEIHRVNPVRKLEGMSRPIPLAYKTSNWPAYNEALKRRSSLAICFDPAMTWEATPTGKRGRQPDYREVAIQICLTVGSKILEAKSTDVQISLGAQLSIS